MNFSQMDYFFFLLKVGFFMSNKGNSIEIFRNAGTFFEKRGTFSKVKLIPNYSPPQVGLDGATSDQSGLMYFVHLFCCPSCDYLGLPVYSFEDTFFSVRPKWHASAHVC
jgi:hypothetical protein